MSERVRGSEDQTIADGKKDLTERMQQASKNFQHNISSAMAETGQAVSRIGSRSEQASRRRQRAE
jgi:hypothetical protein